MTSEIEANSSYIYVAASGLLDNLALVVCPRCASQLDKYNKCRQGHEYQTNSGILDLLPIELVSREMLEEAQHFDEASHGLAIQAHIYFHSKIMRDYKRELASHLHGHARKSIVMADIGCGGGTGIDMLSVIDFDHVEYFGADLSMRRLALASQKTLNRNWNARFMRADAGRKLFTDNSMDIVFCNAALHHLPLELTLEWFSEVLRDNGLLIINEPSSGNLVARIGRKMVSNLNTSKEHPLDANLVRRIAETRYGLRLISQRGMHCFVGPIAFLAYKMHASQRVAKILYALSRLGDKVIGESVRYNYSFMQIYEKAAHFQPRI